MTRLTLLERLKVIQQLPRYQGRDITTISAVLSNEALARHLQQCEEAAEAMPRPLGRAGGGDGQALAGRA